MSCSFDINFYVMITVLDEHYLFQIYICIAHDGDTGEHNAPSDQTPLAQTQLEVDWLPHSSY